MGSTGGRARPATAAVRLTSTLQPVLDAASIPSTSNANGSADVQIAQDRPSIGAEHDGLPVDEVVDRHDHRLAVTVERQAAHRRCRQPSPALVFVQLADPRRRRARPGSSIELSSMRSSSAPRGALRARADGPGWERDPFSRPQALTPSSRCCSGILQATQPSRLDPHDVVAIPRSPAADRQASSRERSSGSVISPIVPWTMTLVPVSNNSPASSTSKTTSGLIAAIASFVPRRLAERTDCPSDRVVHGKDHRVLQMHDREATE